MVAGTQMVKRARTVKPAEERREDLVAAATSVFVRDGVVAARIEDITEAAGVSKGTFYLYFKSKEEAAAAAWRAFMEEFVAVGGEILSDDSRPIADRLVEVVEALTRFVLDRSELYRALYGVAGAQRIHAEANERMIQVIATAARAAVDPQRVSLEEVDCAARAIFHGFCGASNDAVLGFVEIDPDVLARTGGLVTRAVVDMFQK